MPHGDVHQRLRYPRRLRQGLRHHANPQSSLAHQLGADHLHFVHHSGEPRHASLDSSGDAESTDCDQLNLATGTQISGIQAFPPRHRCIIQGVDTSSNSQPFLRTEDQLQSALHCTRERTIALVEDLSDVQLDVRQDEIVNPFRWELGHIAFFYDAFILGYLDGKAPLIPGAAQLYDSFRVEHDSRWGLALPDRSTTLRYLDQTLEQVLARPEMRSPDPLTSYTTWLAVLHEDMHAEAFAYMRQTLEYKAPSPDCENSAGPLAGDVEVEGGLMTRGAVDAREFVFDNEKWGHSIELPDFSISRAPVSNALFQEFVEDLGYQRHELWSHEGWIWRNCEGATHPIYWARSESGWLRRHFDRYVNLEPNAPVVHISYWEAEAYCTWASRRLPTEAEWERAAVSSKGSRHCGRQPWGADPLGERLANVDGAAGCLLDVAALPESDSAWGCRQMLGNVWEWTADDFYPWPGYVVDKPYIQYSAPWFGNRKVLKGGSWATRRRLAYSGYRNFFQPYRRDVIAGFRTCALSE